MSAEVAWLLGMTVILAQWWYSARIYRYVWKRPLRMRYWPFALGCCLWARRIPRWEVK